MRSFSSDAKAFLTTLGTVFLCLTGSVRADDVVAVFTPQDPTHVCGCYDPNFTQVADIKTLDNCIKGKTDCKDYVAGSILIQHSAPGYNDSDKTLKIPYTYSPNMKLTTVEVIGTGPTAITSAKVGTTAVTATFEKPTTQSLILSFAPKAISATSDDTLTVQFDEKVSQGGAGLLLYKYEVNLTGTTASGVDRIAQLGFAVGGAAVMYSMM